MVDSVAEDRRGVFDSIERPGCHEPGNGPLYVEAVRLGVA
jgi:hypothetical protein